MATKKKNGVRTAAGKESRNRAEHKERHDKISPSPGKTGIPGRAEDTAGEYDRITRTRKVSAQSAGILAQIEGLFYEKVRLLFSFHGICSVFILFCGFENLQPQRSYTDDEERKSGISAIVSDFSSPETHAEEEIAGYRNAPGWIHTSYRDIQISEGTIRELHRLLFASSTERRRVQEG